MKKITLLALLLGAAAYLPAQAQTAITIAAARALAPTANGVQGPSVTVRGIVTNGAELGSTVSVIRYIQDGTAGIGVYSSGGPSAALLNPLVPGDSIIVTGGLKMFRGLLEVDPVTSLTVLAGNRPLPAPVVFTAANAAAAFSEQYEGQLVRINGLTSLTTNPTSCATPGSPVSSFTVNSFRLNGTCPLITYVPANSNGPDGLIGKPSPSGTFDAIGIMSQYASTAAGTSNGYQFLSRKYADFVQGNTPNLTSSPVPSNITTTGFTVSFNTQNAGSTQLVYSTSPTIPAGSPSVSAAGPTTTHSLAITGLQPATIYYVQAVSVNATGRSESRVVPMVTASLSSGKIRNYFNRPVDATLALPGNAATYLASGRVPDTLAAYINRATQTLDIAIYNWNNAVLVNAVNAAHARGVRVRVIYEDDNANVSLPSVNAAIRRVGRPASGTMNTSAIMHHKFVIVDANSMNPNVPWVWTGSTNWTAAQLNSDPNNVIAIQDQSLARVYTLEFEEMWGSNTAAPGTVNLFGSRKTDNTPHHLMIGGKHVESYFSPTDNVNGRLLDAIASADNDLHFESMLITRADLARALAAQVTTRNIQACSDGIVNDTSGTAGFAFRILTRGGFGTRAIIDRLSGIMHHKTLIVDAGASQSDPLVFVGSHNWTNAADTENDENTLVVHDNLTVNRYYQEYAARIAEQNQGFTACRLMLATRTGTIQASTMQAYPNPARGSFSLHLAGNTARTATIVVRDATGRVVLERSQAFNGSDVSIDATALKAGLYLVQVTTPDAVQLARVVVE